MITLRTCIALATVVLAASAAAAQDAPSGNPQHGKQLFANDGCYQCHGYVGQGAVSTGGPRLAPDPLPYEAFVAYIREPSGDMPPYTAKILPDRDAADIHAYLRSIPKPPPASSIPLLH